MITTTVQHFAVDILLKLFAPLFGNLICIWWCARCDFTHHERRREATQQSKRKMIMAIKRIKMITDFWISWKNKFSFQKQCMWLCGKRHLVCVLISTTPSLVSLWKVFVDVASVVIIYQNILTDCQKQHNSSVCINVSALYEVRCSISKSAHWVWHSSVKTLAHFCKQFRTIKTPLCPYTFPCSLFRHFLLPVSVLIITLTILSVYVSITEIRHGNQNHI